MNSLTPSKQEIARCRALIYGPDVRNVWRPPPKMSLVEWADQFRYVASKTSATPGRWKTKNQPCAFGIMQAVTARDTVTVTVMSGTQIVKTELLINLASFYVAQDPSPILFVQPTQGAVEDFSKERFAPTVECTPQLRAVIGPSMSRLNDNTLTHKEFPGGSLDFVGANSPTELSSRPKRVILCDEIDKYPLSAGSEGDPLKLAEERASTYRALGRAKFVRTCSPTIKGLSRIGREYAASDQRRLFVGCPHCGYQQMLAWANVRWDKDEAGQHLPATAGIICGIDGNGCGSIWSERERIDALDRLASAPGHGWRQTAAFVCCGDKQVPSQWDADGRSLCGSCGKRAPFNGHAGFWVSKLYSKRHRLSDIVSEFLEAGQDEELLKKWTNSALAELWEPKWSETFDHNALMKRAEAYDGDDLPECIRVVTGFCDVQGDRLEVQLIAWADDEEAWPFQYTIIHQDPAQPQAWKELDALLRSKFKTTTGRVLRIAAFGIDLGGLHTAQVLAFTRSRRGRRIFACRGVAGPRPIWPGRASRAKTGDIIYNLGVDSAKDAVYARLNIAPPEPGSRKPGFIHFPSAENFGPEYFEQLNAERRQVRKRMGQNYIAWVQIRERNEALDTFVGALAMRKSLPRFIERGLEYAITDTVGPPPAEETAALDATPLPQDLHSAFYDPDDPQAAKRPIPPQQRRPGFVPQRKNWFNRE
jgi:phage terminase large subunit GpA-like protein